VAVDESLTLPVPESVVAFYLVPTVDPTVDPVALLHLADQQFAGVLGELVSAAVAAPNPPLAVRPRDTMPPLPMDLFAALGATEAQLARIEEATHFVTASAGSLPGWPSLHEWITRALAAWRAALMVDEDAAFVQLPTTITVSASDVNDAYEPVAGPRGPRSRPDPDTPTLTVRLALDPSSDPDGHDTFISVTPLSSYSLPLETRDPS
jgi:hypothetical protein